MAFSFSDKIQLVEDILTNIEKSIDVEEIYYIIKNDIEPLKSAIQFLKAYIKE